MPTPPGPHKPKSSSDFNLLQCNPATLKDTRTTCLPLNVLERLRARWNEQYPKYRIPATIKTKERLWGALRKRLAATRECNSEFCALTELGDEPMRAAAAPFFRPTQPAEWKKKPTEWHDSVTLAQVMEQYEDAYPAFEFIGPVPIDFDSRDSWGRCIVDELCSLNLASMAREGTRQIGIIFNLDPHYKEGSHWMCCFLDLIAGAAYYYDSYGMEPPAQVRRFLRRCREQGCSHIFWNDIRHQRKTSECGTYCLYILISLLKGASFAELCRSVVPDDTMNALRDLLFTTERPRHSAVTDAIKLLTT